MRWLQLRQVGRCGPWRDEQLAVTNVQGAVVGTVERGAVRVLGIATRAVHLVGLAPDGRMWVAAALAHQTQSPRQWGHPDGRHGVCAGFTAPGAGARNLGRGRPGSGCTHAGGARWSRGFLPPAARVGALVMRERIDWFSAQVPGAGAPQTRMARWMSLRCYPFRCCERVAQGHFRPRRGW